VCRLFILRRFDTIFRLVTEWFSRSRYTDWCYDSLFQTASGKAYRGAGAEKSLNVWETRLFIHHSVGYSITNQQSQNEYYLKGMFR
jgi:hypothetical protein